ncbi:MAG: transporter substrate-binding domain-containing protein [Oscillospiraceae bacterium]|nr:transporter substrate-binding domain-containing protein [Oscillospiraceae bacterium]
MATMLLTTAACGGSQEAPADGGADAAVVDSVQKIKDRGVLKVGVKVDVPKFGYKNTSTGEVEGFEIDLAKKIAGEILGDESKIEVQAVTAKTRGPLLDNGEIDLVIATFTITEERKETYNFSDPYFTDGVAMLVKKDAGFTGFKDMDGATIGVAQSATSKDALSKAAEEIGITVNFSEFASYPELKAALDSGRIDVFSVDGAILAGYVDESSEILPDRFDPQEYGVASKKSNTDLAETVNKVVNDLKASGEMDTMLAKWELK